MSFNVIGENILRVDGHTKVTGGAKYPADLNMENMLYGKTLRSEKAHANFTLDTGEAEAMEGVVGVLTAKDIPGKNAHGVLFKDHEALCESRVRRIGDPIAVVIAESERIAEKALQGIRVTYEELPAVFDPEEAMKEEAPKVHGEDNTIFHFKIRRGDVEKAFEEAAVIVEDTYYTGAVDHAFLQPEAGVSYVEEDGTVTVIAATQYPHFDRMDIAGALGMEEEQVRIINPAVGGAFGGREDLTLQIHLAVAAKKFHRPVKMVYDRKESFLAHCKRHPIIMHCKTAADKEGKLLGMKARIVGDTGAYASWAINVLRKAGVHITGPYEIPNVWVDSYAVYTNNPFSGAMRGFGATQPPIAHEQQMDRIGEKLGLDPFTIRRKNLFTLGSKTATEQVLKESVPLDRCLDALEAAMNKKPLPDENINYLEDLKQRQMEKEGASDEKIR
ncbi:xanthine dehydrogenase family protein molybdopterin-binding subunit [Isachenkonia alkalipeptolytica]|uniref:Aldehyde oxidase n=1 Tax=Isachenkonia alkalipeptolytica TaxID=2565777 RepID=A0AA44BEK2_9CLOT|nr:molybdopterin cofactor-binding domain-containing protein [Isachenkonia alkalipeptolytica]NBG89053.1 aldehyde oxidase [Isachenkonia alkalipeptolytica]